MFIKDTRGRQRIKISEENRLLVWQFFSANEGASQRECAEELGISPHTVGKHVKAIRAGWTPPDNVAVS